jgi:hypothetical protein
MDGGSHPLPCFLEVLILRDFKSLCPEVLILGDFKSLSPEVLILVNFKARIMSKIQECEKILEVLILEELSGGACENGGIFRLRGRCGATGSGCDGCDSSWNALRSDVRARREFGRDAQFLPE